LGNLSGLLDWWNTQHIVMHLLKSVHV
jgi:hypothetical protein